MVPGIKKRTSGKEVREIILILPAEFFFLPADEIAFDGIEVDSDDPDVTLIEQIFPEIFFFFDLLHFTPLI